LYIKLATLIVASLFFASSAYAATNFAVSPPATYAGNNTNGTARTITGALPGDYKEDGEIVTSFGSYSNGVYFDANLPAEVPYTLKIRIAGDLTSGPNNIPFTSLKYMYTYGRNSTFGVEAPGTKYNYQGYVPFSTAYQDVYLSGAPGTFEVPPTSGFPPERLRSWEHQFKYAIQVPANQPPGTYTGTIYYRVDPAGTERTATISVTVGSYFRLSVDRTLIDFEKMSPGEIKDNVPVEGSIINSKVSTGNPWYLKISNDSPLSSGPYIIPNTNLIWYGWSDGSGKWFGNGDDQMTLVPQIMYSSSINEGVNIPDGISNHLKFKLTIPKGQPGGKYISNVRITMSE